MRQTNIVWVGMALGCTVLDKIISQTMPFIKDQEKRSTLNYSWKVRVTSTSLIQFIMSLKRAFRSAGYSTCARFLLQTSVFGAKANSFTFRLFVRIYSGHFIIYCVHRLEWIDCGRRQKCARSHNTLTSGSALLPSASNTRSISNLAIFL